MASVKKLLRDLPPFRAFAINYDDGAEDLGAVVDRLGRIHAARAEMEIYEKALKEIVIAQGDAALEGRLFRITLSVFEQERLDTKAVRADVDEAWLAKYMRKSTVTKVAVHARSGAGLDTPVQQPAAAE